MATGVLGSDGAVGRHHRRGRQLRNRGRVLDAGLLNGGEERGNGEGESIACGGDLGAKAVLDGLANGGRLSSSVQCAAITVRSIAATVRIGEARRLAPAPASSATAPVTALVLLT